MHGDLPTAVTVDPVCLEPGNEGKQHTAYYVLHTTNTLTHTLTHIYTHVILSAAVSRIFTYY